MNDLAGSAVAVQSPAVLGMVRPRAIGHIPSLDGLRALSFLIVFVAHAGVNAVPGGFGVTVFFFLSGFLITTLLRSEFDRSQDIDMSKFWIRRALRILPPCYLVLVGAILAALIRGPHGVMSFKGVLAQLLQYTNYWVIAHGNDGLPPEGGTGVYWSLAVEEHFYLLFPWLYLAMRRSRMNNQHQALLLWGICAVVAIWRSVLVVKFNVPTDRTYMGSDTRIDSIMFGCALAVWYNPVLDSYPTPERPWKYFIAPVCVALLAGTMLVRSPVFRETIRYSLQGLALTGVFVAAIRFPQWLPFRVLNLRPIAFLGVLSYSLYLVHYAVIFAVQDCLPALPSLAQASISLAIAVAVAWIMYIVIEKPCAFLRRRWAG